MKTKQLTLSSVLKDISEEYGYFTSEEVNGSILTVEIKNGNRSLFRTKYRYDHPLEDIITDIYRVIK